MLDHIGLRVSDFGRAKAFFDAALAPMGISSVALVTAQETGGPAFAGYGADGAPRFWIGAGAGPPTAGAHVAFMAGDRKTVDSFYAAALAAGGRDNGAPGIRAHYHPHYYGAFVLDPDGHNIEAVCHTPA